MSGKQIYKIVFLSFIYLYVSIGFGRKHIARTIVEIDINIRFQQVVNSEFISRKVDTVARKRHSQRNGRTNFIFGQLILRLSHHGRQAQYTAY